MKTVFIFLIAPIALAGGAFAQTEFDSCNKLNGTFKESCLSLSRMGSLDPEATKGCLSIQNEKHAIECLNASINKYYAQSEVTDCMKKESNYKKILCMATKGQ